MARCPVGVVWVAALKPWGRQSSGSGVPGADPWPGMWVAPRFASALPVRLQPPLALFRLSRSPAATYRPSANLAGALPAAAGSIQCS